MRIKRVYDPPEPADGHRVLVDRLWPRGMTKDRAAVDVWAKEVAPSTQLRTWFHAHPGRFGEFESRYRAELRSSPAVDDLRTLSATHPVVTLLYSVRDPVRNHARILAEVLTTPLASR